MNTATTPAKLLLVDDLPENLLALAALLREPNVEVLQARSGTEALELLLQNDIALALVDVQMPEMDGFELAELMRGSERTSRVPIIFVTAGAREPSRIFQGYDAGAVDFLFKPIDQHILRHKVNTFVELHRQRQQLAVQVETIRASEELCRQLNEELSATLRLNETFVAAVGHDLRTPLNNVMLSAELLSAVDIPDPRVLVRLKSSAERMSKMIDELFDLARARLSGGIPIQRQADVDLTPVAEKIVAELVADTSTRALELVARGNTHGRWDPDRLGQVLSNLLGNALRHGQPESPIRIELDGTAPDRLAISISNRGQIPADVLPCLFEPFRRGVTRGSRSEGLGLGLFIAQQIVLAHAGTISAESAAGLTTFKAVLPREIAVGAARHASE